MMYPFLVLAQFDWQVSVDDVLKAGRQVNFLCPISPPMEVNTSVSNERISSVKVAVTVSFAACCSSNFDPERAVTDFDSVARL